MINKKYSGSIHAITPFFRFLINRLVRIVFDNELQPKVIHNRCVRGLEMYAYFDAFVSLFTKGSRGFPQVSLVYAYIFMLIHTCMYAAVAVVIVIVVCCYSLKPFTMQLLMPITGTV